MSSSVYCAVGTHSWCRDAFQRLSEIPGQWHFLSNPSELSPDALAALNPKYVFFLHWSHKVPEAITSAFECICFHMTDVPYGRGGSPLQNLILQGHEATKLTALRMTQEFDGGPVYLKEDLSLHGSAQEIYVRAMNLSAAMAERIINTKPEPQPQQGPVVVFKRRKPEQSRIENISHLEALYDFIRMLDADGYPRAFVETGKFRYTFKGALKTTNGVQAQVEITPIAEGTP
jgi:methionyl-tRNA formyltransferase